MVDNLSTIIMGKTNQCIIEIGCGSGIISLHSLRNFPNNNYYAVDINFQAVLLTLENMKLNQLENLQLICTDLSLPIRTGTQFETTIFNPPYLPSDEIDKHLTMKERQALIGGKIGIEQTLRFLQIHSSKTQRIAIIVSSLSIDLEGFSEIVKPWELTLVDEKKYGFEKLWLVILEVKR
jgi:methylase of polypeptide subunit release factors